MLNKYYCDFEESYSHLNRSAFKHNSNKLS